MTYQEISTFMSSLGLPCAYYVFQENTPQAPPFLCWYFTDSDDFFADDVNYQLIRPLRIELYTEYKDFELEGRIERQLSAAGLSFSRDETYLDDERMLMVTYDMMEVIING